MRFEALHRSVPYASVLAIRKMVTKRIKAEGGVGPFLLLHSDLVLLILLSFFAVAVCLFFALSRS